MHSLIIGMTESGKTTLAKLMCQELHSRKELTGVLDPLLDEGWESDFHTKNSDQFLTYAKLPRPKGGFLFIDEGATSIGRYNVPMEWLATMSRHWGHSATFITPGFTNLSPSIRNSCGRLYLFACAASVTKIASEEFNHKVLLTAERLRKGEFFIVDRFREVRLGSIDFQKRKVKVVDFTGKSV